MNILLKSAKIVDKASLYHLQTLDILIENGIIKKIAPSIDQNNIETVSIEGLHVSNGWFDASVSFGEPGFEDRETIDNGLKVAAKSGFTRVAINPNCDPTIDSKSMVNFLKNRAIGSGVDIHPIGNLTKKGAGQEIAELYDMQQAGAIAFGDYKKGINNANIIKIALQYTQSFDGLVLSYPNNKTISNGGIANEGVNATKLGLKGIPALAEELQISRDLFILEYTGGKLHIPTISTAKSVVLIKEAKSKGLEVTCSVSAHHLTLTDQELFSFDANYKIAPPLRTQKDINTLIIGLQDGTIDCIVSDHLPIDIENKKLEFQNALNGSIGLESLFVSLNGKIDLDLLIEKLTSAPKQIFNIPTHSIQEGNTAELTLFDTNTKGLFKGKDILSTSKNSAYLGKETLGKVYGTYHNNRLKLS